MATRDKPPTAAPRGQPADRKVYRIKAHPKGGRARAPTRAKPINNTGKGYFAPGNQGRQPTYRPEAANLAERGATLAEIAAELGCTIRTVSRWRLAYADFREALDRGRERRAAELAAADRAKVAEAQRQQVEAKAAGEATVREAALALNEMLKDFAKPDAAAQGPAPADPAVRLSDRIAARRQLPEPAAEEPQGWQDESAGDPLPLDDPRDNW
ncbi:helix-turn-helix domain-containing protein [Mesorhizobium huakuii]|uniref:Helix-turn-helix domain-containing protein n=1 Tax=Mesorhizobium huakuii TaxID=28104 RepID=A0A7G6T0N5_9HYPH|nr:helix-turn-helix domain-containing protein [Mesorhizobium huakuii]QND60317.1 helix-turn-helix domain-containing protein [Mesorhizobium huakuii]